MIRLLIRAFIAVIANAVGLIVAAIVLDGVDLDFTGFIVALVVFTIVFALMQPFLAAQFRRVSALAALFATFIALLVTDLISDGLDISGLGTWVTATVIVWLAALLASIILPFLGFKKFLENRRD